MRKLTNSQLNRILNYAEREALRIVEKEYDFYSKRNTEFNKERYNKSLDIYNFIRDCLIENEKDIAKENEKDGALNENHVK